MAATGMRAAEKPAQEKESQDHEVKALKDAVGAISKRLDALLGGRGDSARGDEGRSDDDDGAADAKADADTGEEQVENTGQTNEEEKGHATETGDGTKMDADDPPPFPPKDEGDGDDGGDDDGDDADTAPKKMASDKKDSARGDGGKPAFLKDARADATAMRRRIDELERLIKRRRTDEEIDALAQQQQDWDAVAMAHGQRASRPMDGETPLSYERRHAKRYQQHSVKYKDIDLSTLTPPMMAIVSPEIRKDAIDAAYRGTPDQPPILREIKKRDRTGREISEFAGPVSAMLDQFRMPTARVRRINTRPDQY
jgi:hypothetical protein